MLIREKPNKDIRTSDMLLDFKKVSLLVVEDSMPMNRLICSILDRFEAKDVFSCVNGDEAFKTFCRERPDIVIADWMMEPSDGIELTRRIRRDDASPNKLCPVIMLTGYNSMKRVMKARDAGVTEYLVKPFSAQDIANRLAYVINMPRDFIDCKNYFGPDRRRRMDLKYSGPFRRSTDNEIDIV